MKLLKSTFLTSLIALFPVAGFAQQDYAILNFNVQPSALGLQIWENNGTHNGTSCNNTICSCPGEVSFLNKSMSFRMPLDNTVPSDLKDNISGSVTLDNFTFNGVPMYQGLCTTGSATVAGILGATVNPSGSPVVPIFTYTQSGGAPFTLTAEESSVPQEFDYTPPNSATQHYSLTECVGTVIHNTTYYSCNYST